MSSCLLRNGLRQEKYRLSKENLVYILIDFIRNELDDTKIKYKREPTKLAGGLHTGKYVFELENAPVHLSKPLVIRIFPESLRSGYAEGEAKIHNAVHNIGYPAPQVYYHSNDKSLLGSEFTIMEFKEGVPLIDTENHDIPETLAVLHKELHELDSQYLLKTLALPKTDKARYSMVDYLEENINKRNYSRLYPALKWILDNQLERESVVLCHGDFHSGNILWYKNRVSAVLDWGTFRFEEPAFDVAKTLVNNRAFLTYAKPGVDCETYLSRYYLKYRDITDVDSDRVDYYRAVNCLYAFFAFENGVEPFGIPIIQNQYIKTFHELSGIEVPFLRK